MATTPASRSGQSKRASSSGSARKTTSSGASPRGRTTSASRPKPAAAGRASASRSTSRPSPATRGRASAPRPRNASAARGGNAGGVRRDTRQAATGSDGVVGGVKGAVGKVRGPAVAIGATALGVAGGLVLRGRQRRKTVLGIQVPRNVSLSNVDLKSVAKTIGKASAQFGETSKSVSRDIERVGDQAERIGKMLS